MERLGPYQSTGLESESAGLTPNPSEIPSSLHANVSTHMYWGHRAIANVWEGCDVERLSMSIIGWQTPSRYPDYG